MIEATLWNQLLVWPIVNLLIALYKGFEALHFPGPLGFAIIAMTLIVRIVLYPFMVVQIKSQKKMAAIKPKLDELSKRHKDDKQALQQAQMALYKEHGINPASGCLPLLLQLPILFALYGVFGQFFLTTDVAKIVADINHVLYLPALRIASLDLTFLGLNLGIKPSQWQTHGWWLLAIPLITAGLQYIQTKTMMDQQKAPAEKSEVESSPRLSSGEAGQKSKEKQLVKANQEKNKDGKEEKKEDMAMEMQKQMSIISPIMFGFFAYQFPLGLALYWNVFGIFAIIQQLQINKTK
jgi:YidC/Oxa1 family membrane protein insertase